MGRIEKVVKKHEQEKHLNTKELIGIMKWDIDQMGKLDKQYVEERNNLKDAYNARIRELAQKMEAQE